jgi:signal transduction histidine kinase
MPARAVTRRFFARPMLLPWLVFILTLSLSLATWIQVRSNTERELAKHFDSLKSIVYDSLQRAISLEFDDAQTLSAMLRRDPTLSDESIANILRALHWQRRHLGIMDIGVAFYATNLVGTATLRVQVVESRGTNSLHVRGFDLQSEPGRRAVIDKIMEFPGQRAGDVASLTDTNAPIHPGVVQYHPFWNKPPGLLSPEERQPNLRGVVFVSIDQTQLLQGVMGQLASLPLVVTLVPKGAPRVRRGTMARAATLNMAGGEWRLDITPSPLFYRGTRGAFPTMVLISGLTMSTLLGGIVWIQTRRRAEAERANLELRARDAEILAFNAVLEHRISGRTAELIESQARLRASEEELRNALEQEKELVRLKTNFVSLVSHEFRTPLSIIQSAAEVLEGYFDRLKPERRNMHLQDIGRATRRMADLMEEVLLLSHVDSSRLEHTPKKLDLEEFCRRLADELLSATNGKCPIELSFGNLDGEVSADESLLRHIFTNLLSNAVKYSPAGNPVHFQITRESRHAIFVVRDSGIGIPDDDLPHLFQAFRRGTNVSDTAGTGLGLVIVKRCVELQGGEIAIESREGVGTILRIRLPLFTAP